jgi:hypothetical protein
MKQGGIMNALLKLTVLLGMVHSVTASVPPSHVVYLSSTAKPFVSNQHLLQSPKSLSDIQQENKNLREQVSQHAGALAAWQKWADDLYQYHCYLEETGAFLERDLYILTGRHERLMDAYTSLLEQHRSCKIAAALAQPSVVAIWSPGMGSVENRTETNQHFCPSKQLEEPTLDLECDLEKMGDQES